MIVTTAMAGAYGMLRFSKCATEEGDSYFPVYEDQFTTKTFEEDREWNGLNYRWIDLER